MIPELVHGNALHVLASFPAKEFQCCITSPPYFGLRDYNNDNQIGQEPDPESYVEALCLIMDQVWRVLKDDGVLWLNLGDSYTSGNRSWRDTGRLLPARGSKTRASTPVGLKSKELIGIPWRVAFALQSRGWYLRQDIIWHKPNPMPESVTDRCTKAHEYLFMLTKNERYYFDHEAMKEPAVKGASGSLFHTGKTGEHQLGRASTKPRTAGNKPHEDSDTQKHTRNRRSVWTIATKPYRAAHFATFPEALVEPCVLAGSKPGNAILDPFTGSGTVGVVCKKHGREFTGIDTNKDYIALAEKRIG